MVLTLGLQAVGGIFVAGFTSGEVGAGEGVNGAHDEVVGPLMNGVDTGRRRVLARDNAIDVAENYPGASRIPESAIFKFPHHVAARAARR